MLAYSPIPEQQIREFDENGYLKRDQLRKLVFSDDNEQRKKLESILHPLIFTEIEHRIETLHATYCILVIPLLIETQQTKWVDRVLVVDISKELQIQRINQRDKLDKEEIQYILGAQCSREQRLQAADEIITNEGTIEDLAHQVAMLHEKFLKIATTSS